MRTPHLPPSISPQHSPVRPSARRLAVSVLAYVSAVSASAGAAAAVVGAGAPLDLLLAVV